MDLIIISPKFGTFNIMYDYDDYEKIMSHTWHIKYFKKSKTFMPATIINKKTILMHRFLLNPDNKKIIDHINHNPLDNRRCNLRICNYSQNNKNRLKYKKTNLCRYKGVHKRENGKYRARIRVDGKLINLGHFDKEIDAIMAYNDASIKYHGMYGQLNIIGVSHEKSV